jgi:hypothetical protein
MLTCIGIKRPHYNAHQRAIQIAVLIRMSGFSVIGVGIWIDHLRHQDSSVSVTISLATPAASTLLAPPESQRDSVLQPRVGRDAPNPGLQYNAPLGHGDVIPGARGRRRHRGHGKMPEDGEDMRRATSCCIVSMVGTRFRM